MKFAASVQIFVILLAVFSFTIINIPSSFSQTSSDNPQLFTPVVIGASSDIQIPTADTITQTEPVKINMDALKSEQMDITLFEKTITISKDRITTHDDYYTWFGSGDNINAVIVVDGTELAGQISTSDGIYGIVGTDSESVHFLLDIDTSQLPPEEGDQDITATTTTRNAVSGDSHLQSSNRALIAQLEDAYIGGRDYYNDKVTIDVYVAYTEAVEDDTSQGFLTPDMAARLGIGLANASYRANHLPLELNLVDSGRVTGYTETDTKTMSNALDDISDADNRLFDRVRADAVNEDADIVVLFVDRDPSIRSCGQATGFSPDSTSSSYAVVGYDCIRAHTFAHEIGHLQGADHNKDFRNFGSPLHTNPEFSYGHGYYELPATLDLPVGKRTIMSEDCDNNLSKITCERQGIWSDPYDSFIASANPVGIEDTNWNAKVLFATGPYVASLRGPAQTYDSDPPGGAISLSDTTIIHGTVVEITATFDEEIHDRYPPHITITDGTTLTTVQMTKVTNNRYTVSHGLTSEIGIVSLFFSNARDIYGNTVIATPIFGHTFTVLNEDRAPTVSAIPNIILDTSATRNIAVTATDPDGDAIILSVFGASFATIFGNTITLSPFSSSNVGDYTITVTATANGKKDIESFTVTLVRPTDTTPPIIAAPRDVVMEATSVLTRVNLQSAIAIDNVDLNPTITNNAPESFPLGSTIVTYTAKDDTGNFATDTQTVTIQDTTLPVFVNTLQDATHTISDPTIVINYTVPDATDIFLSSVSCTPAPGSSFSLGINTVTCTATDTSFNTATTSATFTVSAPVNLETVVLIDDSFNTTLDSWSFQEIPHIVGNNRYCSTQNTDVHSLSHSTNHGGSALTSSPSSYTCWFGSVGGVKSFTVPATHDGAALEISLDYRNITSFGRHVNNMFVMITDSDDNVITKQTVYQGERSSSLTDTNWQEKTLTVPSIDAAKCPCDVFVYTIDSWGGSWKLQIYFDNVHVSLIPQTRGASGASHADDIMPPNTLKKHELFEMIYANNTKIVINTKQVYDNSILIKWDVFDDSNNDYKVVIATPSDPRDKSAYIVSGETQYRFLNLTPDTQYNIAVGIRGDDSTQSILKIRTSPEGSMHFDGRLILDAQIKQDSETVGLSWVDRNGIGENRYRVERSVDGDIFELTALSPRYGTTIDDQIDSEWYGKIISYRIFERLGDQKLFSNPITVTIPLR